MKKINVMQDVLSANEYIANENKAYFKKNRSFVINIMSSPGSGKTSTILQTIKAMPDKKILVIEGDIAGDIDARKIEAVGTNAIQINTAGMCHLDARMIHQSLEQLENEAYDYIFVENVGNLICPTAYNLGEDVKVVILSIPEGEDKPLKYPKIFQIADVLVLNKIDMKAAADFDENHFKEIMAEINPDLKIIPVSCKTGEGIDKWVEWLNGKNMR